VAGFDDLFRRYRLKDRGGRGPVEQDIKELQKAEAAGEDIGNHFFIFDLDHKPTSLTNSAHVRLLQLNRYCLENFLLDLDILTDLSRNKDFSDLPKQTTTELRDAMKSLAMAQMDEHVARAVFQELGLEEVKFDMRAVRQIDSGAIAAALGAQLDRMQKMFSELQNSGFDREFVHRFEQKRAEQLPVWDEKWQERCNGKQLLEELRRRGHFKGDLLRLKKAVIARMRQTGTDVYNSLDKMLRVLLGLQE
jgi:hypothetical protein